MYRKCPLYALKSKKKLASLLHITDKKWFKEDYVQSQIYPYIDKASKPRLVEAPSKELKLIQKKIKNYLMKCDMPLNIYSGVKGKSYVDNAKEHLNHSYLYKIDISAFFPNISREKVYCFFIEQLQTSPDVAKILTNLCTSNLNRPLSNELEINNFLKSKGIRSANHLCTGSSPSPILSYLVNQKMFNEIEYLCVKNRIHTTVYVDDIVLSSSKQISILIRKQILAIVNRNGYNISTNKVKYYKKSEIKKVTGVIIKPNKTLDVPNRLRYKIIKYFNNANIGESSSNLKGCLIAAKEINSSLFPSIYEFIKK